MMYQQRYKELPTKNLLQVLIETNQLPYANRNFNKVAQTKDQQHCSTNEL